MYEFGRKKGRDFDERKRSRIYKFEITEERKKEIKFTNLEGRKEEISMKGRDLKFTNLK